MCHSRHWYILLSHKYKMSQKTEIWNSNLQTWITLIQMTKEMDAGPVLDIAKFDVPFDWTSVDIIEKMKEIGPKFLTKTLKNYPKWLIGLTEQDSSQITFCGKIEKEEGEIDICTTPLSDIYAKYRAFYLWPKVYFVRNNKKFIVENLKLNKQKFWQHSKSPLVDESLGLNEAVTEIQIKSENGKKMDRKSRQNGNKQKKS